MLVPPVRERLSEAELLGLIADIDGVISGDDEFTEKVLLRARRLKVISKWGTGTDSIDREACARLGIEVRNTPGAFTEPVADHVLGYLLCFARQLVPMAEAMRQGAWMKIPGRTLGECTLGIVGVGTIGRAVAKRAAAFGMTVLGNDPRGVPAGIPSVSLRELLEQSDFVSLNCDLNPTSRGMIDERALARMKPAAVLINTARGPVVDEPALTVALQEGRIAGAALDVFVDEPLPASSPLRAMKNVLLSPHNASSSPRAWERVHRSSIDQLFSVLGSSKEHPGVSVW